MANSSITRSGRAEDSSTATSARRRASGRRSGIAAPSQVRCAVSRQGRHGERHRSTQARPGGQCRRLRDERPCRRPPSRLEAGPQRRQRVGALPPRPAPEDEVAPPCSAHGTEPKGSTSVTVGERPWDRPCRHPGAVGLAIRSHPAGDQARHAHPTPQMRQKHAARRNAAVGAPKLFRLHPSAAIATGSELSTTQRSSGLVGALIPARDG